jgi:hypothetical protein
MKTINRFFPLIQTELNDADGRQKVVELLGASGYSPHQLVKGNLVPLSSLELNKHTSDFYFIHNQ